MKFIDKLALIFIKNHKILVVQSKENKAWFLPGGKREEGETDKMALTREVKEELSVDVNSKTLKFYGIFEAQAYGKPKGTIVRIICYEGSYKGKLTPSQEITKFNFFSYSQKRMTTPVSYLLFDDLKRRKLLK